MTPLPRVIDALQAAPFGRIPCSAVETRARLRPGRRPDPHRRAAPRCPARDRAGGDRLGHRDHPDRRRVGPIVAGTVLGYLRDINRFPTADRFASYNGTHRSRSAPAIAKSTGFPGPATAI